jgi:hypothetical protein
MQITPIYNLCYEQVQERPFGGIQLIFAGDFLQPLGFVSASVPSLRSPPMLLLPPPSKDAGGAGQGGAEGTWEKEAGRERSVPVPPSLLSPFYSCTLYLHTLYDR